MGRVAVAAVATLGAAVVDDDDYGLAQYLVRLG